MQKGIFQDRVEYLYRQSKAGFLPLISVACFVVFAVHEYIDNSVLIAWLSANTIVIAARYALYLRYMNTQNLSTEKYLRLFFIGAIASATVWGAGAILLFVHNSVAHQVFLAFIYGGVVSAALVSFGIFKKIFITYISLYLLPLVYSFAMYGGVLSATIITIILLFSTFLVVSAFRYEATIYNGMQIKYENMELIEELNSAKMEVESLNNKLSEKLEMSLQEINRQQGLLVQQSKLAAMGEMIGNIAHQWRQPLNALGIAVQDIGIAHKFNELNQDYIDDFTTKSMTQINYMSKTIDDFRDFVKPDKKLQLFDVGKIVSDAVALLSVSLNSNGIKCHISQSKPTIQVMGNSNEFKQVIMNLISNSVDAIKENNINNGQINIGVDSNYGGVIVKIHDNGGGIAQNILDRVFEPYFTTKEEGKGTGVGLYMSHTIVCKKMGGTMEVRNETGGAVFTIILPDTEVI